MNKEKQLGLPIPENEPSDKVIKQDVYPILTGKELLDKINELDQLGKGDQYISLACGYECLESFDNAYAQAIKSSVDLESKLSAQHQEALIRQKERAAQQSIGEQSEQLVEHTQARTPKIISIEETIVNSLQGKYFQGRYLAAVINALVQEYKQEEIAIACGYYETNDCGEKVVDLPSFVKAKAFAMKGITNEPTNVDAIDYLDDVYIIRGYICTYGAEYTDTWSFYIPKRIIEESKDWDYSQIYFTEFKSADSESNNEPKYYVDHVNQTDVISKKYDFKEPMMSITPEGIVALDNQLEWIFNSEHLFSPEEVAECYGLRFKDVVMYEYVEGT